MHSLCLLVSTLFLSAVSAAAAAFGTILPIETYDGATTGRHIVKLKSGLLSKMWINQLGLTDALEWDHFNSFAARLSTDALDKLRAAPDVELISEDGLVHTSALIIQTDAPWGVARLSSLSTPPSNYTYDDSAGGCADIYIVDTGVYIEHHEFTGRASWGYVGNYSKTDANGHGTHCAGTAAGTRYGVAKKAKIIAVKVLGDSGSGSTSDIIAGLNWIMSNVQQTGRPSVVNLSIGGAPSTIMDNAVTTMTNSGIHVVVAAGNSNTDASNFSPGRVPSVITVGGATINDIRMSTSNFGAVVDIYAPGQNIISAWISCPEATNTISGTSSAAAHVSGLVAYLLCKEGSIDPAQISTKLKVYCLPLPSSICLAHNTPH